MQTSSRSVTQLLIDWGKGDEEALEELTPLVYDELHRLASRKLSRERDRPLQTTELIDEAYIRLIGARQVEWRNRAHFFAIAARLMRQALVDYARAQQRAKRCDALPRISLEEADEQEQKLDADLVALDDALLSLAAIDERKSRTVELRFFGGLSVEETAQALNISPVTVKRDWRWAKAWLLQELSRR
jgi:RNA polymerase sigma factor (TIGR02999 family)